MDSRTIIPTSIDSGIVNLQRIQPSSAAGRRRRETPKRRIRKKPTTPTDDTTYTPDGHVTHDEHGIRVDISA